MGSFEVASVDGLSRLVFAGPGPTIVVTLVTSELTASVSVAEDAEGFEDPAILPVRKLKDFFADLADRWMDDARSITYQSPDSRLRLHCRWDGRGHFYLNVALQKVVRDEPLWTLEAHVVLETSMLPRLASLAANDL